MKKLTWYNFSTALNLEHKTYCVIETEQTHLVNGNDEIRTVKTWGYWDKKYNEFICMEAGEMGSIDFPIKRFMIP